MDTRIEKLFTKLEELNKQGGQWNIDHQTGQFLHDFILKQKPQLIVEVGASNGYSTIWFAMAAKKVGAKVITFEFVPEKVRDLVSNLQKSGLVSLVEIIPDDVNKRIKDLPDNVDFIFLDGRKNEYLQQIKAIEPKLANNAVIIADNAISHKHTMSDYLYYVENEPQYDSQLKDIGTGLEISYFKKED